MIIEDKVVLRKNIWSFYLKSSYGRIPIFDGAVKAANKFRESDEWINSKYIFI